MSTLSFIVRATAVAWVLAACGGGGGDGRPAGVSVPTAVRGGTASAGSDLSAGNAQSFVGPAARLFLGAADGNTPGLGAGRESPQARSGAATVSQGLVRHAAATAARAALSSGREQPQAVTTQTQDCPFGGSLTLTLNDADNNNKLSAGDTASFVFNACVVEAGLPPASGSLTFTVNAIELDANNEPTALDASFTLTGLVETGLGAISGSVRIWFKDEGPSSSRQRVSFLAATVSENGQTLRYDFDQYGIDGANGGSFDLNGAVTIGGQTYELSSDVFGYTPGVLPSAGALRLRDAAGDTLILRARTPTTFDLEFQANGAAAPTVIAAGLAWSSFRLGN